MLKSKIHRARVTEANLLYEGSISIDEALMAAADLVPHEHVHVWNLTNGSRFETYAIPAPAQTGTIQINGAAAHHAGRGDEVIISSFAFVAEPDLKRHAPRVVLVDPENRVKKISRSSGT